MEVDNTVNFSMPRQAAELRAQSPTADFSFGDFVDIINPLQHIPIISNIYRSLTGDTVAQPAAQIIGDGLYGGPIGAMVGVITAMISGGKETDPLEMAWNALGGDDEEKPTTMVAQADTASTIAVAANDSEKNIDLAQAEQTVQQKTTNTAPIQLASNDKATTPLISNPQPLNLQDPSLLSLVSVPPKLTAPEKLPGNPVSKTELADNQPSPLVNKLRRAGLSPYQAGASMPASYSATVSNEAILAAKGKPLFSPKIIPAALTVDDAQTSDGSQPLLPANDFSQKMMQALDRYQASAKAGQAKPAATPTLLNSY